jgi:hypothetical protein
VNHKYLYLTEGAIVPDTIKLFYDHQEKEEVDPPEKEESSFFVELRDERTPQYYSTKINVAYVSKDE